MDLGKKGVCFSYTSLDPLANQRSPRCCVLTLDLGNEGVYSSRTLRRSEKVGVTSQEKRMDDTILTRRKCAVALVLTLLCPPSVFAQDAISKWKALHNESEELYLKGDYDRALVVTKKALEVAENNIGPDHPAVATSLSNMAGLYRDTNRETEAEAFEQRAARILTIRR